jgi:hypothetical protein
MNTAQLLNEIEQLPPEARIQVENLIVSLRQKQTQETDATEQDALAIHAQLMAQYEDAFQKLAQ